MNDIKSEIGVDTTTLTAIIKSATYKGLPGEDYMSKRQLIHFETLLSLWRLTVQRNINQSSSNLEKVSLKYADESDKASQEEELRIVLQTRMREREILKKIEDALLRLKRGDFGYCEGCDLEIGLKRLEVQPTTRFCIDCKTQSEIRVPRRTGGGIRVKTDIKA